MSRAQSATIYFFDGTKYRLTPDDILWTARAVVYEGGDAAATLWTLTQRYFMARTNYPSFGAFVRAFSQPVNPDWASDGKFCAPGGRYHDQPNCSPAALARRTEAARASWANLIDKDPRAVAVVQQWAAGVLPNPVPRATNFADQTVASHYLAQNPSASLLLDSGNWYLVEGWAKAWPEDAVTMQPLTPTQRFFATLWDAVSHPLPRA